MVFDRLRRRLEWRGTSGTPRSGNGASSMHLFWDVPAGTWVEAHAVLEVLVAPTVAALSFWALQVSFRDGGRSTGGAHLGLQWFPPHPGSTAVNWGGYADGGGELSGSDSALPSATGNVNTRDFAWQPGRRYRLRVRPGTSTGWWAGEVTDLASGETVIVRELHAGGDRLEGPMVWSEIFARCDDPGASVRWSELTLVDDQGSSHRVESVLVNYQAVADGGCVSTTSRVDEVGIVQASGTERTTSQGTHLAVRAAS